MEYVKVIVSGSISGSCQVGIKEVPCGHLMRGAELYSRDNNYADQMASVFHSVRGGAVPAKGAQGVDVWHTERTHPPAHSSLKAFPQWTKCTEHCQEERKGEQRGRHTIVFSLF